MTVSRLSTCCAAALCVLVPAAARAQDVTWKNRVVFYGDNTEFFTPYREGETLLGAQFKSYLDLQTGATTGFIAGVYADHRSGAVNFLDSIKPLIGFRYHTPTSFAALGTLETVSRHGFLEPMQVTTLEINRPVEYGLQWIETRSRWNGEIYLNWQHLNTPTSREIFDYGLLGRYRAAGWAEVIGQLHGVHHGGQLFSAGQPVANNQAVALGLKLHRDLGRVLGESYLSAYWMGSHGNVDLAIPDSIPERGHGGYYRAGVRPWGWFDLFAIYWKGRNFLSNEGDNNYNSVGKDPTFFRSRRTYKELGAVRRVDIENGVTLDFEVRLHQIDNDKSVALKNTNLEYSYRLMVTAPFDVIVHRRKD